MIMRPPTKHLHRYGAKHLFPSQMHSSILSIKYDAQSSVTYAQTIHNPRITGNLNEQEYTNEIFHC